jgi:hypothetical protein
VSCCDGGVAPVAAAVDAAASCHFLRMHLTSFSFAKETKCQKLFIVLGLMVLKAGSMYPPGRLNLFERELVRVPSPTLKIPT